MAEETDPDQTLSKRKAISTLLPYAISLGRGAHQGMADEIIRATVIPHSGISMWGCVESTLFAESSSPSLNRTIILVAPYLPWTDARYDQHMVDRWAAAVLAARRVEEVCESVVDVLLQITSNGTLRPLVPDDIWALLKNRVSLPPVCRGRSLGTGLDVVLHVRGRGDVEILKSYYLLIWSEWDSFSDPVIDEMETSIREDLGGVRMWGHREDLMGRLDHVLAQLDLGSEYLNREKPGIDEVAIERAKEQYTKLRDALMNEERETLTSRSPKLDGRFQEVG